MVQKGNTMVRLLAFGFPREPYLQNLCSYERDREGGREMNDGKEDSVDSAK